MKFAVKRREILLRVVIVDCWSHKIAVMLTIKDWICKDKDKDEEQAYKDQDKDKDKDLSLVLKESLGQGQGLNLQLLTASCS